MAQQNWRDTVALVTGANRGIGHAITEALLTAGAPSMPGRATRARSTTSRIATGDGRGRSSSM